MAAVSAPLRAGFIRAPRWDLEGLIVRVRNSLFFHERSLRRGSIQTPAASLGVTGFRV